MSDAAALQSRLNQFAASFSRAEIARKTGTSVMNVSRYLKGTRVPAEFCMALVREFGVNANWLLAGQGGPYVSDLATQHGQMAGNLLELVEAMSAVARMRLGSLAGKEHMKMLRGLNDALGTYERLRAKLNEQSRGVFTDVLREFEAALKAMDMARAGALRKAAEQVARLCDDDALATQLIGLRAHHAFLAGRTDEATELIRKRFAQSVADGTVSSEEQAQTTLRLIIVLHDAGRAAEALRIGRAFLALAGPEAEAFPSTAGVGVFCAHMLGGRGDVREALPLLERWLPLQEGRNRAVSQAAQVLLHLLAGLQTFDEALAAPGLPQPKHAHILGVACALEDAAAIRACMKFVDSPPGREVKERMLVPHYAPLLARALERRDRQTLRDFAARRRELSERPGAGMELNVYEAQLRRVLGDVEGAAKLARQCEEALQSRHDEALGVLLRSLHLRNRQLCGDAMARDKIAELVDRGCRVFRPWLEEPQSRL
jgi:transcriptional regulator with XRE-family HTH domain